MTIIKLIFLLNISVFLKYLRHKDERRHRTLEEGEERIDEPITENKDIKEEEVAKDDDVEIVLSDDGNYNNFLCTKCF